MPIWALGAISADGVGGDPEPQVEAGFSVSSHGMDFHAPEHVYRRSMTTRPRYMPCQSLVEVSVEGVLPRIDVVGGEQVHVRFGEDEADVLGGS